MQINLKWFTIVFKDRKYQIGSFFRYRKANQKVLIIGINRYEIVIYKKYKFNNSNVMINYPYGNIININ